MNKIVFIIFIIATVCGCTILNQTKDRHPEQTTKEKFEGTWEGEHFNKKYGFTQKWIQKRTADGKYTATFKIIRDGILLKTVQEDGKWWIEDNKFYLINSTNMTEPDVCTFKFLSDKEIEFTMISHDKSAIVPEESYIFVDTKID